MDEKEKLGREPQEPIVDKEEIKQQNIHLFVALAKARNENDEAEILRIRNEIVELNKGLAVWVANKFSETKDSERGDIESAAYEGLIFAVDHFDSALGFQFYNYAFTCIMSTISRRLNQAGTRSGLDADRYGDLRKATINEENFVLYTEKLYNQLRPVIITRLKKQHMKFDYEPTEQEINDYFAQELANKKKLFMNVSRPPVSLDQKRYVYNTQAQGLVPTEQEVVDEFLESDPEEVAHQIVLAENIYRVLGTIPPKQAFVLAMRYGFLDLADELIQKISGSKRKTVQEQKEDYLKLRQAPPKMPNSLQQDYYFTLKQIGKIFSISLERTRQIEAAAIKRLRYPAYSKHLGDFIEE